LANVQKSDGFLKFENLKTDYISSFLKTKILFSEILGGKKNCLASSKKLQQ